MPDFLQRPGLWPYAALTNTGDRASVLRQVAQKIDALDDRREQGNLSAITAVMSGLSGKAEERQEIALNMLRENMSLETIVRITGLSIAQLQQLQVEKQ